MTDTVITGATGVVGRRAVRELPAGCHRVAGVTRPRREVMDEAPEHRAHFPALADPPAHPRLPPGGRVGRLPFTSLYLLDDEWAAEIVNRTVHGVIHVGWSRTGPAATSARWPFW
jgi:nucleoside-diphosphate-sugar epimerase